jgi:hypothetical protein
MSVSFGYFLYASSQTLKPSFQTARLKKLIVENESLKLQVSASNAEIQAIKTHLGL